MSDNIHIEVAGFQAITEFNGNADDCGPCAEEVCLACQQNRVPDVNLMNQIRTRDIERGWFTPGGGNTLDDIYNDATQLAGVEANLIAPYGSDTDTIHGALKAACLRGNPCVLQLANAGALPQNEKTVYYHFVAVGGIDSTDGYLIANGDDVVDDVAPYWVKWLDIEAAQPIGVLEFIMPSNSNGGTTVTTSNLPSGWSDDGTYLRHTDKPDFIVQGGIRQYLLANTNVLSVIGYPLENERKENVVGMDPSHGPGWEQIFNNTILICFASNGNVVVGWMGAMFKSVDGQLKEANDNVTKLTSQLTDAQNQIAALNSQIDSLKNTSGSGNALTKTDFIAFMAAMNDAVQKI